MSTSVTPKQSVGPAARAALIISCAVVGGLSPALASKLEKPELVMIGLAAILIIPLAGAVSLRALGLTFVVAGWIAGTIISDSNLSDPLVSLGGELSLTPTKLLPFLLLAPGIFLLFTDFALVRRTRPPLSFPIVVLILYVVWLGISSAFSPLGHLAWLKWAHGTIPVLAFLAVAKQVGRSSLLLMATLLAGFVHVVMATLINPIFIVTPWGNRLSGYLHPVLLALLGATSAVVGTWMLFDQKGGKRLLGLIPVTLGAWAIWASSGRMGFAAGVGGVGVVLLTRTRPGEERGNWDLRKKTWATVLLVFVGTITFAGGWVQTWLARGTTPDRAPDQLKTLTGRTVLWQEAVLPLIAERPVLGWGPGLLRSGELAEELKMHVFGFGGSAHNSLLEAAVAGGVVAAVLWLGVVLGTLRAALKIEDRFRSLRLGTWTALAMMSVTESGASWWGIGWYLFLAIVLSTVVKENCDPDGKTSLPLLRLDRWALWRDRDSAPDNVSVFASGRS